MAPLGKTGLCESEYVLLVTDSEHSEAEECTLWWAHHERKLGDENNFLKIRCNSNMETAKHNRFTWIKKKTSNVMKKLQYPFGAINEWNWWVIRCKDRHFMTILADNCLLTVTSYMSHICLPIRCVTSLAMIRSTCSSIGLITVDVNSRY